MSDLVAVAYPDLDTAEKVMANLGKAIKEHVLELDDAVIVERKEDGKVKLHQSVNLAGAGAVGGALWGGLIGLLFLQPLLGMALGAAGGAAGGALSDVGVDDKFMKELGEKLEPGNAAVFVLVRKATIDKVLDQVEYKGEVLQTSLDHDAEERLKAALAHAGEDQPAA